ncbi:MAG: DUF2344 domain-containing protein [Peptococcaceae bacterium]|nr:DUF2344 domain-containing protein [Peptococcaceae bacterium]
MPRIRVAYRQNGAARFVSHLDVMRAFERAMRRAGLKLSYTQGFNPRPKLTFAAPLPVGMVGLREYVDIVLDEAASPFLVMSRLGRVMPKGLSVLNAREVPDESPNLMAVVHHARYLAKGFTNKKPDLAVIQESLQAFLARREIYVERQTSKGVKRKDIRPGIRSINAAAEDRELRIGMELKAGQEGNVRPYEVLTALQHLGPVQPDRFVIIRTALLSSNGRLVWEI